MSQEVTIELGNLYAELHEQYDENLGEQYTQRLRQNTEEFIHNLNQQVERQREQAEAQEDIDLEAEDEA
jgi:hypothetical protein